MTVRVGRWINTTFQIDTRFCQYNSQLRFLCNMNRVWGAPPAEPAPPHPRPRPPQMRISLPRHDLLEVANLSEEKGLEPVPQWAFIGFNLNRNTGEDHQSLSGSNDQTIDNIQRTMRAYSKSGSDCQRAIKLWETNSFYAWTLISKLRAFLAKQISQDFVHSFLGLIAPGNYLFLPRAAPPSVIVSGLKSGGRIRQLRD